MEKLDKLAVEESQFFSTLHPADRLAAQTLMFASRVLPVIAEVNNRRSLSAIKKEDVKDFFVNPSRYNNCLDRRIEAARARGRKGGRPKKLNTKQIDAGVTLAKTTDWTVEQICEHLSINRSTYYRYIHPKL